MTCAAWPAAREPQHPGFRAAARSSRRMQLRSNFFPLWPRRQSPRGSLTAVGTQPLAVLPSARKPSPVGDELHLASGSGFGGVVVAVIVSCSPRAADRPHLFADGKTVHPRPDRCPCCISIVALPGRGPRLSRSSGIRGDNLPGLTASHGRNRRIGGALDARGTRRS